MMIGTSFGVFYPTLRLPNKTPVGDLRNVQIRARRRRDLVLLKELHLPELSDPVALKDSDYQFRAYCTSEQLAAGLADIALKMNYTAFKHTPKDQCNDDALFHLYERIWSVHLAAFPTGSKYAPRPKGRGWRTQRPTDQTVIRRGEGSTAREWVMAGSDPVQLARLMREIDDATADVVLPSEDELNEVSAYERARASLASLLTGPTEVNGHLDHSSCAHNATPSARRKCRKRFYGRS
jgi:hypothetical protein